MPERGPSAGTAEVECRGAEVMAIRRRAAAVSSCESPAGDRAHDRCVLSEAARRAILPRVRGLLPPAIAALLFGGAAGCRPPAGGACAECSAYEAELAAWRAEREAALRGPEGWLALAGLRWLDEGEYVVGADPGADVVFPAGAPAELARLTVRGGEAALRVAEGASARLRGEPVREALLRSDAVPGVPADRVQIGDRFVMLVIARGGRLALRWYDAEAPERRTFAGLEAFPADPRWRVRARFEAFDPPRTIEQPTVVGVVQAAEVPGVAVFTIAGREHRLTPIREEGPAGAELLFVFSDETSRAETYRGGRFLITPLPGPDGTLELDFNRAHNPPCAFTAYATCPAPRDENYLPLRVTAGELAPRGH